MAKLQPHDYLFLLLDFRHLFCIQGKQEESRKFWRLKWSPVPCGLLPPMPNTYLTDYKDMKCNGTSLFGLFCVSRPHTKMSSATLPGSHVLDLASTTALQKTESHGCLSLQALTNKTKLQIVNSLTHPIFQPGSVIAGVQMTQQSFQF